MSEPRLYQRFSMHVRLQGGALYVHHILDADGKIVGQKSVRLDKKKRSETSIYFLEGRKDGFSTRAEFMNAYIQQLRDKEWESAAPKGIST